MFDIHEKTTFTNDKEKSTSSEDLLKRYIFVDYLADAIENYDDEESLTIGLYGKWGEGKTSVINFLKEKLETKQDIIYFSFEPWLYSNTEQLISMFFKDFSKVIGKHDNMNELSKYLKKYAEFFETLSVIPEPEIAGILKLLSKILSFFGIKLSCQKNLLEQKADIENYIKSLNKKIKILIVIDDIDRLNNKEIQQIFQLVKMLGNFKNTIYLMSMDKDVVVKSLKKVQNYDGYKYLEKIVQIPLKLPDSTKKDIYDYLKKNLKKLLSHFLIEKNENIYFERLINFDFVVFFNNLRDVNRYLNIFRFKRDTLKNLLRKLEKMMKNYLSLLNILNVMVIQMMISQLRLKKLIYSSI